MIGAAPQEANARSRALSRSLRRRSRAWNLAGAGRRHECRVLRHSHPPSRGHQDSHSCNEGARHRKTLANHADDDPTDDAFDVFKTCCRSEMSLPDAALERLRKLMNSCENRSASPPSVPLSPLSLDSRTMRRCDPNTTTSATPYRPTPRLIASPCDHSRRATRIGRGTPVCDPLALSYTVRFTQGQTMLNDWPSLRGIASRFSRNPRPSPHAARWTPSVRTRHAACDTGGTATAAATLPRANRLYFVQLCS